MTQAPPFLQDVATGLTRRWLCRSLLASLGLPVLVPLAGCGSFPALEGAQRVTADGSAAALLLPLTGSAGALGQNMGRAASLVTQGLPVGSAPAVIDTGDTAAGAAAAAQQAIAGGAKLLLGPLRADQTPAVLAVAGNVPVITFSNDDTLGEQGAFVMGITPAQSVATMFTYAKSQGISRIAVLASDTPFGRATIVAAQQVAAAGGLVLTATLLRDPAAGGHLAAITSASGGVVPQAIFIPDGGNALVGLSEGLSGRGAQLMGSVQWSSGAVLPEGAWYAAPAPDLYQQFAADFRAAFGVEAGVIVALGYDATLVAQGLSSIGQLNDKGLRRAAGFTGVLGPFRFTEDRRCIRDLAVLRVSGPESSLIAEIEGS